MSLKDFYDRGGRNPSTGTLMKNPSHDSKMSQYEIVKTIVASGRKPVTVVYEYAEMKDDNPPPIFGIVKVREMSEEDCVKMFKMMMRSKPSIFGFSVKLGDYPETKQVSNSKTKQLSFMTPKFPTQIGEILGTLMADKTLRIVEVDFIISTNDPNKFSAIAEVYTVPTDEIYHDDQYFKPTITLNYISPR